jgi:hypothetical protein
MRVAIRKVGKVTRDRKVWDGEKWQNTKVQTGQKFKMELTKSKLSKPFAEEWFTWDLTTGSIDMVGYMIAQGLELNIIDVRNTTWLVDGNKIAIGKDKFRSAVESDPDLLLQIENRVRVQRDLPVLKEATVRRQVTSKARMTKRSRPLGNTAAVAKKGLTRKRS